MIHYKFEIYGQPNFYICHRMITVGDVYFRLSPLSYLYHFQLIRLLLSPFAAFALCLLILSLCRSSDFHKNSRLLLIFTAIFMILADIGL